ncbi:MAG: nucleotidyltransferase domain-containing protein [Saccharofermentans sp.]|nr:nucleotidyltransferase domain-containing protein [Saccharofermentans sp.]
MDKSILTIEDIRAIITPLAYKYNAAEIWVFGSYARGDATSDSDIDLLVSGGDSFKPVSVFELAEEARRILRKNVDMFEISEINTDSSFYDRIMREKVRII